MKIDAPIAVLGVLLSVVELSSGFFLPLGGITTAAGFHRSRSRVLCAHDILVTLPGGEQRTVAANDGQTILEALEAHDIDAPHSCRSGLCTE